MAKIEVRFQKKFPHAIPPKVSQPGDVAADLFSAEAVLVPAGGRKLVSTGIILELPDGFRASIRSRSGLSLKHGIEVGAGLIDQSFRHEIGVLLYNHGEEDYRVEIGDRVAQICVERFELPSFVEVEKVEETPRATGWGSSGK